ncbi:hypothetical protein [Fimbriiglobus ruber]|uniref:Glycine-rich RNA-binding protein GRP1A n=1 Tax=Fimbriiglobus ruber TaxID=1908690 RepID=A0A225DBL5_9BACT|nr:hypothetical protein [Fimbriiglobus ruber]OWK38862.1 Glycine-rich RNA-binding protein GRP1A [Fimbriiglobus ruber]
MLFLFTNWLKKSKTVIGTARRNQPRPAVRLFRSTRLDVLGFEDRTVPATFTVTTTTDSGATDSLVTPLGPGNPGDLRNAIFQADQSPGTANVIDLTGVTGTISLSAMLPPIFTTGSGSLTITGPGAANLTVSGGGAVRPFFILQGDVTISDLTIANGLAHGGNGGPGAGGGAGMGGGLLVDGTTATTTVTLTNVTFDGDQAVGGTGAGGGGGATEGGGGGAGGNGGGVTGGGAGGGGGFLGNGAAASGGDSGGGGGFSGAGGTVASNGTDIGGEAVEGRMEWPGARVPPVVATVPPASAALAPPPAVAALM